MGMMIHRYKGRSKNSSPAETNEKRSLGTVEKKEYADKDIALETQDNGEQYTKTEINRMNTAELQNLAAENGIEDAYEKTGSVLKQELIEKFGL